MKVRKENLVGEATVKGTMLQAHLQWAETRNKDARNVILAQVPKECAHLVTGKFLATDWVPYKCLIGIDRAIAQMVGGSADTVFREMGRNSAAQNLGGVYKSFVAEEPHRFFENLCQLHRRFQNFGNAKYDKTGERGGRIAIKDYHEYSPVFCASGIGYYEEALRMMHVPGPIRVVETSCRCADEEACVFEMAW